MSALGPMAGPPPQVLPLPPGGGGLGPGGPPGMGPGGPPGMGPGGPSGPPPRPGEEAGEAAALHAAADALQHALMVETDPADKAMIAKLVQGIHDLLANRDKEKQDAMGASPALKLAMRQSRQ